MDITLEKQKVEEAMECIADEKIGDAADKLRQSLDSISKKLSKAYGIDEVMLKEGIEDKLMTRLECLHNYGCMSDDDFKICNSIRKIGNIAVHDIESAQSLKTSSTLKNCIAFEKYLNSLSSLEINSKVDFSFKSKADCYDEPLTIIEDAVSYYFKNSWWTSTPDIYTAKKEVIVKKAIYTAIDKLFTNLCIYYGLEKGRSLYETFQTLKSFNLIDDRIDIIKFDEPDRTENFLPSLNTRLWNPEISSFAIDAVLSDDYDIDPFKFYVFKKDGWSVSERTIMPALNYIVFSVLRWRHGFLINDNRNYENYESYENGGWEKIDNNILKREMFPESILNSEYYEYLSPRLVAICQTEDNKYYFENLSVDPNIREVSEYSLNPLNKEEKKALSAVSNEMYDENGNKTVNEKVKRKFKWWRLELDYHRYYSTPILIWDKNSYESEIERIGIFSEFFSNALELVESNCRPALDDKVSASSYNFSSKQILADLYFFLFLGNCQQKHFDRMKELVNEATEYTGILEQYIPVKKIIHAFNKKQLEKAVEFINGQ